MEASFATWVQAVLTLAIAVAAFMQWFVYKRLAAIEANREKVRLVLRFAKNPQAIHRLSLRVANLSSFGVMVERVIYAISATYADGRASEAFQKQFTMEVRDVLAAFSVRKFDLHNGILITIDHRNAQFRCEIEASAVYLEHGATRTTPIDRVTVTVGQERLVEFPEG